MCAYSHTPTLCTYSSYTSSVLSELLVVFAQAILFDEHERELGAVPVGLGDADAGDDGHGAGGEAEPEEVDS